MLTREGKFAILFYNCKGVFYEKIYLISKSFLIFFIRNLIYTQVFRDTIVRFSVNIYTFCKIIPSDFSFQGFPITYIFLFYIISSVSFVKLISFCTYFYLLAEKIIILPFFLINHIQLLLHWHKDFFLLLLFLYCNTFPCRLCLLEKVTAGR